MSCLSFPLFSMIASNENTNSFKTLRVMIENMSTCYDTIVMRLKRNVGKKRHLKVQNQTLDRILSIDHINLMIYDKIKCKL